MADVCLQPARSLESPVDTSRHHCECMCPNCERNGTGWFAQRAALAGDPAALEKLAPTVRALVALIRTRRYRVSSRRSRSLSNA